MTALLKLLHLPVLLFILALSAFGAGTQPVSFSLSKTEADSCTLKASIKQGAYLYAGFTVNGTVPELPPLRRTRKARTSIRRVSSSLFPQRLL